ncbi:MAG TPA: GWxTD domain-containing protein [Gemmatimonadales bacterium]|jgi:GWxTD domain-containing protein|nr:GWxTD domain-containing protein [Gemmatimonadales bacterium]
MTTSELFRRSLSPGLLLAALACGSGRTPAGSVTPSTEQTLTELFNLPALYQRMGRLAASGPMPFVGSIAFVAGRGDSTIARVAVSFENHAFAFTREARSFSTRFRVEYTFTPGAGSGVRPVAPSENRAGAPVQAVRDEIVRVGSFAETQRGDESVIVEQGFLLAPGSYTLSVTARDPASNAFSRAEQVLEVPAFRPGSVSPPILVYQARPRQQPTDSLMLVLNPRGTVANGGGDSLLLYEEGYQFAGPRQIPIEVRDDRDSVIFRSAITFQGGRPLEAHVVRLASDAPPLGELRITVGEGPEAKKLSALVSFSRSWVVTSYDNLLALLRYFLWAPDRLNALRSAKTADRPRLWREFWIASDPRPETPENEALDLYFTRIALANQRFNDEGGPGWRTDRGEVFVTLGEPDQIIETPPGTEERIVRWYFSTYRVTIDFTGRLGFSRLRMTVPSRAEFARARAQAMRLGNSR